MTALLTSPVYGALGNGAADGDSLPINPQILTFRLKIVIQFWYVCGQQVIQFLLVPTVLSTVHICDVLAAMESTK